jgi:peptidoglycan hydrolase-like protein with peptidoglycan-binding domain
MRRKRYTIFMMKKYIVLLLLCLGVSNASALTCVDLGTNVSRYQENANVRSMQGFLYEKGYLKATPNGYFGAGTYAAMKAYQKDKGITQTGTAGPLTRMTIKNETCGALAAKPTTTTTQVASNVSSPTTPVIPAPVTAQSKPVITTQVAPLTKNEKRWNDSEVLLRGLYQYFVSSRGVWPLAASATSTTPIELCVAPKVTEMASTSEVALVVTAASPCKDYVDVSYLSPYILTTIPREPNLASTSVLLGYSILRDELNNISIVPKVSDNKEIIKVRCNFDSKCVTISRISQEEYGTPVISGLSRTVLLKDANPKVGVTVSGKNFTSSTTVILQSKVTQRLYETGPFVAL